MEYPEGITEDEFGTIVANGNILVDVYTTWCGPCKRVKPIFQELSMEMEDVKFMSIDLDQARWIGNNYDVHSIPTFLFFHNGEIIYKHIGAMGKESFLNLINDKF
jgi:thioredoxin 1